jgi:phage FluMu protein Com
MAMEASMWSITRAIPEKTTGKYILNPAEFPRERKLDNCALCHSGMREPKRLSFSYKPGDKLEDFLKPASSDINPASDVHGNQVGLLELSKCFRSSPTMSCSTCHNVHQEERDLTKLAQKCLRCHRVNQCKQARKAGSANDGAVP